jgi:hypothetical protein
LASKCREIREIRNMGFVVAGVVCDDETEHYMHHDPDLGIYWFGATSEVAAYVTSGDNPGSGVAKEAGLPSDDRVAVAAKAPGGVLVCNGELEWRVL